MEEEHRSSDSLPDFPFPIHTAKHKVPKKFSEKNPTQMTGKKKKCPKRKSSSTDEGSPPKRSSLPMDKTNTKKNEAKVSTGQRRKGSIPKKKKKSPKDDEVNISDMEKVYHISMSESINQLKLDETPQIVLLNPSIQKCNG